MGNTRPSVVPSQEARELELSGGVRSLPQVPRWNAGRRARPKRKGGASRLSVARPARRCVRALQCASAGVPFPFFYLVRHCEERGDEAIQNLSAALDCFASLAMTPFASLFDIVSTRPARRSRRENGGTHPPPRKWGRGTTLRSRVVEGASDSTLRCRRRKIVTARAPPSAVPRPAVAGRDEVGAALD
jgi:hypothetical protein